MKKRISRIVCVILFITLSPFLTIGGFANAFAQEVVENQNYIELAKLENLVISGSPVIDGREVIIEFDWAGDSISHLSLTFNNSVTNTNVWIDIWSDQVDENGHVKVNRAINEYLASGIYELKDIYVSYLNDTFARESVIDSGYVIEVQNINGDSIAPVLQVDSINMFTEGNTVIIDFKCIETGSGLQSISFGLADYSGICRYGLSGSMEYNILQYEDGYRLTYDVRGFLEVGTYTLVNAYTYDNAFNYEFTNIASGINFEVTPEMIAHLDKLPGLDDVYISGSPVINGSEITIDYDWTGEIFQMMNFNFFCQENTSHFNISIEPERLENGHVHSSVPVDELLPSGSYILNDVSVYYDEIRQDSIWGDVYQCYVEVNNSNQDISPPELLIDSIEISMTETEMVIDFDCIESGAGLNAASFWFSIYNEYTMQYEEYPWSGFIEEKVEGYKVWNNLAELPAGDYTLKNVYLADNVGNTIIYDNNELQNLSFTINPDDRYTVTFDSQGGSEYSLLATFPDESVSEPYPPEKNGYIFDGWYTETECTNIWNFNAPVVSDTTLYARWKENTPAGSNVSVTDSNQTVSLVFDVVTTSGITTVDPLSEPDSESYFYIEGTAGYFDINSTAQFDDKVKITVKYDPTLLSASQIESELRLYQFKDGIPIDITDPETPVDTVNKTITGIITDHFCVFSVGIPENHDVNVTYTGSTLKTVSDQKVLTSQVTAVDPEDNLEYTNIFIEFSIKGTDGIVKTLQPVQCNSDGIASVLVELDADVYSVDAKILENGYAAPASDTALVVIYDPSGGFVTGGGWIESPEGAYMADQTAVGKANFGFVSKYQKGAVVPSGNTEFQFKLGSLNFHSNSYEWLVVNKDSKRAQYKGTGTINGSGSYKFMIWASDNGSSGDSFRIKIWNAVNEDELIYDNGSEQVIGGGQIAVIVK